MTTLILTVIGDDRPGLVSAVSAPISAQGGSWERSRMARLAGKFVGIVLVTVPDERVDPLVADLGDLGAQGLQVAVERTDQPAEHESQRLHLDLMGADHPGIVAEISTSLASCGVSIEELTTDVRDAPMAGGTLFEAHALLSTLPTTSTQVLRSMLESLADDLMVEINLSDD